MNRMKSPCTFPPPRLFWSVVISKTPTNSLQFHWKWTGEYWQGDRHSQKWGFIFQVGWAFPVRGLCLICSSSSHGGTLHSVKLYFFLAQTFISFNFQVFHVKLRKTRLLIRSWSQPWEQTWSPVKLFAAVMEIPTFLPAPVLWMSGFSQPQHPWHGCGVRTSLCSWFLLIWAGKSSQQNFTVQRILFEYFYLRNLAIKISLNFVWHEERNATNIPLLEEPSIVFHFRAVLQPSNRNLITISFSN